MSPNKSPEYVEAMRELNDVIAQKCSQSDEGGPDVTDRELQEYRRQEDAAYYRMAKALGFSGLRAGEDPVKEVTAA